MSTTQDNQFAPGSVLRFTGTQDTRLELKGRPRRWGIENTGVTGCTIVSSTRIRQPVYGRHVQPRPQRPGREFLQLQHRHRGPAGTTTAAF
ncbi:MAG: hypothetical protein U1F87_13980 [Kiritimatiellia bacterium]